MNAAHLPLAASADEVPDAVRALCPFRPDYVDAFTAGLRGVHDRPAEEFARAAVEGASAAGRFIAWRVLSHLRLGPCGSSGHIGGWEIADRSDAWVRLEARSWFMTVNVVFWVERARIWFVTFVRYDHPVGRLIWTRVSAGHRAAVPSLLENGVRRVQRMQVVPRPSSGGCSGVEP